MPACQVGNLEYALSLDPSNTLLQKRLSEAKVGCWKWWIESDGFLLVIFFSGRRQRIPFSKNFTTET